MVSGQAGTGGRRAGWLLEATDWSRREQRRGAEGGGCKYGEENELIENREVPIIYMHDHVLTFSAMFSSLGFTLLPFVVVHLCCYFQFSIMACCCHFPLCQRFGRPCSLPWTCACIVFVRVISFAHRVLFIILCFSLLGVLACRVSVCLCVSYAGCSSI